MPIGHTGTGTGITTTGKLCDNCCGAQCCSTFCTNTILLLLMVIEPFKSSKATFSPVMNI